MRRLYAFLMVSLDGCHEGAKHDLSWHNVDEEFNAFASRQLDGTGALLMGRRTYEMLGAYWPRHKAKRGSHDAAITRKMNALPKFVVSKTLRRASWKETSIIRSGIPRAVKALKRQRGGDIAVFGSSQLCTTLLEHRLIDELRIMLNPVFAGAGGTPLFEGLPSVRSFRFIRSKRFSNGNLLLTLRP